MPATYAHYRFGSQMLQLMPADMGRTAKRYRRLYDVGLHGPDIFYYYPPGIPGKTRMLGYRFHLQSGKEFFGRVCRTLRLEPSEAAQAYLYGVLCHYALDAACHPYVEEQCRDGLLSHSRLETEFDAFLFEKDGNRTTDLSRHIRLAKGESQTITRFYPGAQTKQVEDSVKSMAAIRKLLALPEADPRRWLTKAVSAVSREFAHMVMGPEPDIRCQALLEPLLGCYEQAVERFPGMLNQLGAHLTYNAPLGEEFSPIFG